MAGAVTPWFPRRPGEQQGRVKDPPGFPPPGGDHAVVLGSDSPNWTGRFVIGDRFDFSQSDVISPGKILRFTGRFRGPSRMPAISVDEPAAGYALADGQTLILAIDGGSNQTITFSTAQFSNIGAARAIEVRDAIASSSLTGATAFLTGEGVGVLSSTTGRRSRVEVIGGTATALNFQELGWRFQILLASTVVATRDLQPGETEDLNDMAGNLAAHGDPAEVRFRLQLVAL